ncbi:MAG: DUF4349 domain-containing protein [Lawsonibacter sp.]|nr:DUF4349 domain-containing protein [Lawsonibacter sp.]
MKKRFLVLCTAAALLLSAGCGGNGIAGAPSSPSASYFQESQGYGGGEPEMDIPMYAEAAPPFTEESSVYQNSGAKLIRRAELYIQTEQFDQATAALNQLVVDCGGYFENASVYGGSARDVSACRSGEYVVRVPAENYQKFKSAAGDLGYVTNSSESSEDVGQEYHDTESQLKTLRTKQERLLGLLEKAATMEDIISLENALSDTEYQIEMLSSTLNRYDALIGFSTFHIYLSETTKVTQEVGGTSPLGQRMSAGFTASLEGLVQGFQNLLVWVSYHFFGILICLGILVAAAVLGRGQWKKLAVQTQQEIQELQKQLEEKKKE